MAENGNGRNFWIDAAIRVIDRIGFPIVVAAFLLWRMDPAIQELNMTAKRLVKATEMQAAYSANSNCRLRQMMGELKWQKGSCDNVFPVPRKGEDE